jgi:hypothetical protein
MLYLNSLYLLTYPRTQSALFPLLIGMCVCYVEAELCACICYIQNTQSATDLYCGKILLQVLYVVSTVAT